MDILFLLIPLSVVLAFCIGWFFWRAVDTGQFDDFDTPSMRILADNDTPVVPAEAGTHGSTNGFRRPPE